MNLEEFAQLVPALSGMSHVERIRHFAWFMLTQEQRERFGTADVRRCYEQLHYALPGNISQQLQQMADKKPPDLLKDRRGFRLEGRVKEQFDGKYGQRQATIAVDAMLQGLPGKISDEAERLFLSEALTCFRSRAFRATIVMTWNVAYDHLLNWIMASHLPAFNAAIPRKFPKKASVTITAKEDFSEEFKEFDVIELCGIAGIIPSNMKKILNDKLTRRNLAAHPSLVEIKQYQAEDAISDLVENVILKLT
jgi:hypothetical protein